MLADFFTKPLQSNLFRTFRDVILGYSSIKTLAYHPVDTSQLERVGSQNVEGDLISSDDQRLDSDAYVDSNMKPSVEGRNISYLEAAKKSLEEKE